MSSRVFKAKNKDLSQLYVPSKNISGNTLNPSLLASASSSELFASKRGNIDITAPAVMHAAPAVCLGVGGFPNQIVFTNLLKKRRGGGRV